MSSENKMLMTRVFFGVASVGATLALVYLYNKYQDRKGKSGNSTSVTGSRMRRHSVKSGEVKKVTFKTDDEDTVKSSSGSPASSSKLISKPAFVKEDLGQVPPPVATHDATVKIPGQSEGEGSAEVSNANSTNSYESSSTLKLEDNNVLSTTSSLVTEDAVEEVTADSKHRPLMTSTPLPGKEQSQVPLRMAASFDQKPDSSDRSPAAPVQQSERGRAIQASETDYDSHSFRREMKIPRDIVPGLIGKKGSNIKAIQMQSDTHINFNDETLDNGDRICVIRGAPTNVTIAESMIEKYILEQPIVYTEVLSVPLSSVGRIIGRGGDTIRSISELSKARVNVDSHQHYGDGQGPPTRTITIKGSETQIKVAKQLIIEKVEEERSLRKNIDVAAAGRTHRRPGGGMSPSTVACTPPNGASSVSPEPVLPVKQDGMLEVFVSCVYHPNDFWIQVVGRDSIELDKLCESMTDHYNMHRNGQNEFHVGDIVAAPFEVDSKMYRAKIMKIEDKRVEVSYLDYGDRRVLSTSDIHELHPKFLQLRYQAIQATLNLGCIGEKWEDEVINEFCDLTYCAQWQSLTARVKDYLKDVEDGHDVIWIELLDKKTNLGEKLVQKGLATPKGPSGCNGAQRKSYAAVALGVANNSTPTEPVISSSDPTVQESYLDNDKNGN